MAQLKAHEFDRFLGGQSRTYRLYLLYGPDRGLVSERATALANRSGVDLDDAFSLVRLDADALRSDPGRLVDEAAAIGLFGGARLIWLKGAGNDRGLADAVAAVAAGPAGASTVLIEAGDLKKGAPLRKVVEDSAEALAIPCYADEERGIQALIDAELAAAELRITPAARERLAESLGGDRLASRGELRKLALYCMETGQVTEDDVIAIVGDASAVSVDAAVDAVLVGDVDALDLALQRLEASKTGAAAVLLAVQRQFQALDAMKAEAEAKRLPPATVLQSMGRGLHFRRKPLVEAALGRWGAAGLARALNHLQRAVLEARRSPRLEADIVRQALMAVALQSRRRVAG